MRTFATMTGPVARVTGIFVTFSLLLGAGISTAVAADAGGSATRGKELYLATGCYQCHGTRGAGGAGPRLAPGAIPIEAYKLQLRRPRARMPVYTTIVMPEADIADIYAYLLTIPRGKSAAEIPLLKAISTAP
jgi:mono/diheme cytochrome c family protein